MQLVHILDSASGCLWSIPLAFVSTQISSNDNSRMGKHSSDECLWVACFLLHGRQRAYVSVPEGRAEANCCEEGAVQS